MTKVLDRCLKYKVGVIGLALALGLSGCWLLSESQPEATLATPAKAITGIATTTVQAPVKVYSATAKKTLALPAAIQQSATHEVLTATDVPKSRYERTITTVLDTESGEAVQYVQDKPLPLFDTASTGNVGAYVGYKGTERAIRISATQDLFTVKALTFGAVASVDVIATGRTDTFVGVGARLDW